MPPTWPLGDVDGVVGSDDSERDEADEVAVALTDGVLAGDAGVTWMESPSSEQPAIRANSISPTPT